jgi:DNA-binding HxlR family transcriptional regulator
MKRTSVAHFNCSVAQTLEVVGEWWTLLIVRNVMFGQHRFEAIQADLGIARNILSDRLATLV